MRARQILAALCAAALCVGCDRDSPTSVPESLAPSLETDAAECWAITAYYWDEDWVPFASWDGSYLPNDLRINFDAWNWDPHYPAFQADFDNVYAYGDLDLPEGLVDDFNDGVIDPVWTRYGHLGAPVYEAGGVLNVDIPAGTHSGYTGGLRTDYVVHGEFDVQIDFALSPGFHSEPPGGVNVKLIIQEEHPPGGGFPFGAEVSIRVGQYIGVELGPHGWFQHGYAETDDLVGKLRISRTKLPSSKCRLVHRPYHWSVHDLPWPGGVSSQLQSVYPLDAKGDLVLVGGHGHEHDYVVFDFSSGSPESVAGSGNLLGWHLAAHSPLNSPVGFGAGRDMLVKYDGTFELIPMPCGAEDACGVNDVWAGSPTDVWIARTRNAHSEIWHWNGDIFELEYQSELADLWGIWGFPGARTMFAAGDRILQRNTDGVWQEVVSPGELPACLGHGNKVRGMHARDVWVGAGYFGNCMLHYDGTSWSEVPAPSRFIPHAPWLAGAGQLVVAGQLTSDPTLGRIAIWGSVDAGQSWTQVEDPVFIGQQGVTFFDMAGTQGGTRIFAPTIRGGRLVIGSLAPMQSHVTAAAASAMAQSVDSEELILPEPEK